MKFYEKLDFIMNITKTTNSTLAMYTSLDSSHISRLRRGERKLVKNAGYLNKMATYFANHCTEAYQHKALAEALKKTPDLFCEPEKAAEQIYLWLVGNDEVEHASISGFLDGVSKIQLWKKSGDIEESSDSNIGKMKTNISLHYGIEGKREAVLTFLSMVLNTKKPNTLLLYSDESMEWLTGDLTFTAKWGELLSRVIAQGNRIKIIHNVSRDLNEMLEALAKWIPLYMTGAIEPYYYPKKRDGIFKRTLFIAPKIAAVTSTSIEIMEDKALNILLKDANAVNSLIEEFNSYFSLCKPLMRIFTHDNQQQYLDLLREFEKEDADVILKSSGLSWATMPNDVAESIIGRLAGGEKDKYTNYFYERKEILEKGLERYSIYEILHIPTVSEVSKGRVSISFAGITETTNINYTLEEYKAHLENTIQYLIKYENYHIRLINNNIKGNYSLYVKEDLGAIVSKTNPPQAIFAISENNITAAFWDYLKDEIDTSELSKEETLNKLRDLYNRL
ncbi:transcriptional regulator [Serpentinicella alkaliphila]|uniref:Uncharacterized protein n=1 Tax=Serpentinicella alkaliphila TaxID=1734049 RepID=A0A4R2TJJ4_9FIRM|nr:transcriptional regulator [Serpentinicella alkaliphila]QUH25007.1 transcriptional regulator [Serpentinicella alkaliphila]TCQ02512.1 hypothetical protein EDD79_101529 [Serpentinicella alkaliphila]